MRGLIVENTSNLYKIKYNTHIYESTARGKLKQDEISPVVGDYVEFSVIDENKNVAIIEKIYDRNTYIKRPKMANLSQIIYVVSSKHPKPDLLMLDKQLIYAELIGLNVVIVLNKIDLDDKKEFKNIKEKYTKIGYSVLETDAKDGIGIIELQEKLLNNISAFSGNSGVGKSTLINAVFRNKITLEGEISLKNKKGKNTTTITKLYEINSDSYIADTPGFSTFDISEIKYNELDKYFTEFMRNIEKCKYVGCTHIKEEECGIKKAIEKNKISESRYENYKKIYLELKEMEEHKW